MKVEKRIKLYTDEEMDFARKQDEAFSNGFYEQKKYLMRIHPLRGLFLEVTSRCNAHCEHCGSSCGDFIPKDEIEGAQIKNVLREIYDKNYNTSRIMLHVTGGEPLLRKDLFDIMKYAKALGFHWGITSNGMLIDEEMVRKMADAQITSVSISIDGPKEIHESFRQVPGSWEKILHGIKLMQQIPSLQNLQVTTCVNKKNIDYLDDVYKTLRELGVTHWRIMEVDPIGRAKDNHDILLDPDQYVKMFNYIAKMQRENPDMNIVYGCGHFLGMDIEPVVRERPFNCYTGVCIGCILSNGDIYVCPDVERRPEFIQGNIRKDSFTEVWENKFKPFRTMNRTINDKCKKCKDWKLCMGDAFHTWDFDLNKPRFCHLEDIQRYQKIAKEENKKAAKTAKPKTTKAKATKAKTTKKKK